MERQARPVRAVVPWNDQPTRKVRKRARNPHQGMNWIRRDKRLAIYIRDSFQCMYCERDLSKAEPGELQLDHLLPSSCGGSNDQTNLVTACRACNVERKDQPVMEFLRDYIYGGPDVSYREAEKSAHWHMGMIAEQVLTPLNRELAKSLLRGGLREWLAGLRA